MDQALGETLIHCVKTRPYYLLLPRRDAQHDSGTRDQETKTLTHTPCNAEGQPIIIRRCPGEDPARGTREHRCVSHFRRLARSLITRRVASRIRRRSGCLGSAPAQPYRRVQGQHRCGDAETFPRVRFVETDVYIVFQQVDIDGSYDNLQSGPQINMFGVTQVRLVRLALISTHLLCVKEGHSVLAHITGFMPYFYVPVPRGFEDADIPPFMSELNVRQSPPLRMYMCPHHLSQWSTLSLKLKQFTNELCGAIKAMTSRRL